MSESSIRQKIDSYTYENLDDFIELLDRLCRQPSVSAQNQGITECAALTGQILSEYGIQSEVIQTGGNPIVYGHVAGKSEKTLLFYLHYDVQPAEPLDLWSTPPFQLTRVGDKLYARGAADDKGHIVARLAALAAVRYATGDIPCSIKFVIEGEEELGSPNLSPFILDHQEKLSADACIWEFGGVNYEENPTMALGMRGICYTELSIRTADRDAHSGLGGSIFPNAAWRLVWALNSLKDENERILIPGFYDDVRPPTSTDLDYLASLPDNAESLKKGYGLSGFVGGPSDGLALRKAAVFKPACTICGLTSGYQGPGSKTIVPAQASAKVDFRLVPEQSPEDIVEKLRLHLDRQGFEDVEINVMGSTRPAQTSPENPFVNLTIDCAKEVYNRDVAIEPIIGGSGPNYPFIKILNLPVVSAGVAYPESNAHAPDEHIRIGDLIQGIRHTAYIMEAFGR